MAGSDGWGVDWIRILFKNGQSSDCNFDKHLKQSENHTAACSKLIPQIKPVSVDIKTKNETKFDACGTYCDIYLDIKSSEVFPIDFNIIFDQKKYHRARLVQHKEKQQVLEI